MGVMFDHDAAVELLGAWALDACTDDEMRAVAAHVAQCDDCTREAAKLREAAGWLGALEAVTPPPSLEAAVMATARARRSGAPVRPSTPAELLAHQADALGVLLASLRDHEWDAVTAAGWTVHELVGHLLAAASYLTWHLGLLTEDPAGGETAWVPRSQTVIDGQRGRRPADTAAAWRVQAELLLAHVSGASEAELKRPVPWFDGEAPMVVLAIVHAFETWVHAEDMRRATGRAPEAPSAADVARMSNLAVRLVADFMADGGHEGRAIRVVLTGAGGGDWTLGLGGFEPAGPPDVTLTADVVAFCTLIGGRLSPAQLPRVVEGDGELGDELLRAAASLAFP